jgi:hypothetical protein
MTPYIKKGPVYVDGVLAFTATRDLFFGDVAMAEDIVRPDGTAPWNGDAMTAVEKRVLVDREAFTQ